MSADGDSSLICLDTPEREVQPKREASGRSRHPLLESVSARMALNAQDRAEKAAALEGRREAEVFHSRYLKGNVADKTELDMAAYTARIWGNKHGLKTDRKILKGKRRFPSGSPSGRRTPIVLDTPPPQRAPIILDTPPLPRNTDMVEASSSDILANMNNNADRDEVLDASLVCFGFSPPPTTADKSHHCPVMNCGSVFKNKEAQLKHLSMFKHSPCNPDRTVVGGNLSWEIRSYICPQCELEFQDAVACQRHMSSELHMPFFPPLAVAAYLCPQCLCLFDSARACQKHINDEKHRDIAYPFKGDFEATDGSPLPVPVGKELAGDFCARCGEVTYKLECLECGLEITGAGELKQHLDETQNQHIIAAHGQSSVTEVFAHYLTNCKCNNCNRLCFEVEIESRVHRCAENISGKVVDNDCPTFRQYVKQCSLSFLKSLRYKEMQQNIDSQLEQSRKKMGALGVEEGKENDRNVKHKRRLDSDSDSGEEGAVSCLRSPKKKLAVAASSSSGTHKASNSLASGTTNFKFNLNSDRSESTYSAINRSKKAVWHTDGLNLLDAIAKQADTSQRNKDSLNKLSVPKLFGYKDTKDGSKKRSPSPYGNHLPVPGSSRDESVKGGSSSRKRSPSPYRAKTDPKSGRGFRDRSPNRDSSEVPKPSCSQASKYRTVSKERTKYENNLKVPDPMNYRNPISAGCGSRDGSPYRDNDTVSVDRLKQMRNIIFLDLDNWSSFFTKLPKVLPDLNFVWAFFGGKMEWRKPYRCYAFDQQVARGLFNLHERCGNTKDATDFAIVLTVGKMDVLLPAHIPFTILSGDKGFCEVERQMKSSERKAVVIDPHAAHKFSNDMIYQMVTSVCDT